jgi:hypothetical protein
MTRKYVIFIFILVSLDLIHFTLGFAAYESEYTALINNLRCLVEMAAKEQVQAASKEQKSMIKRAGMGIEKITRAIRS